MQYNFKIVKQLFILISSSGSFFFANAQEMINDTDVKQAGKNSYFLLNDTAVKKSETETSNTSMHIEKKSLQQIITANTAAINTVTAQDNQEGKVLKKGMYYAGLLLAYSNTEKENVKTTFENIVSSTEKQSSLKLGGGYFLNNRMAAGLGVNIGSKKINKELKNVIGSNTITEGNTNQFGISPNIRNFIGIGKSDHFDLYAQTGLLVGFENGTETSTTGNNKTMTDIKSNTYGISFTPGIVAFVEKGFAFEVNVGVGGVNYEKETRKTAGQPNAVTRQTTVDLNINILKLNLGLSYYF